MQVADTHVPVIIVGGGVIGLSIAFVIKKSFPHLDIALLDQGHFLGDHASGRNSGVLHAGLYYPEDSLKKQFCIRGRELWDEYSCLLDIPILKCGKYIMAKKSEGERFFELFHQAVNNGAEVELCDRKKVDELNQFSSLSQAFFSPDTSVIDPALVIKNLERACESVGVIISKRSEVLNVEFDGERHFADLGSESISSDWLINAAGVGAVELRKNYDLLDLEDFLVKGHYMKTHKPFYNKALLYPLPEEGLTGLGIHTCIDFDGSVKFGPDTLAVEKFDYHFNTYDEDRLREEITSLFKIDGKSLNQDFCGIRSKIHFEGELYSDFWIKTPEDHNIQGYVELCGIESPGLTSCWAIAEFIKEHLAF